VLEAGASLQRLRETTILGRKGGKNRPKGKKLILSRKKKLIVMANQGALQGERILVKSYFLILKKKRMERVLRARSEQRHAQMIVRKSEARAGTEKRDDKRKGLTYHYQ